MTKKILAFTDFFYPDFTGGSAMVAHQVHQFLIQQGYEMDVITRTSDHQLPDYEQINQQNVYRIKVNKAIWTYPNNLRNAWKLINEKCTSKYDLVISHHAYLGILALRFAKKLGLPLMNYFYGPWHKEAMFKEYGNDKVNGHHLKYKIRMWIDSFILRNANINIILSEYTLKEAQSISALPTKSFSIVPGGVDLDKFSPAMDREHLKKELNIPTKIPFILTIRRLDLRMGLINLIEATRILHERGKNFHLVIGGKGDLYPVLEKLIATYQLKEKIKLIGFIPENKLVAYYASADLFVLPSLGVEGFGLSTVEALACGTPVLGTNSGATPEILSPLEKNLLLNDAEPQTIANQIEYFFENLNDPQIRVQSRKHAEKYSWNHMNQKLKSTLESIQTSER